jgi:hypothetical protein
MRPGQAATPTAQIPAYLSRYPRAMTGASGGDYVRPESGLVAWRRASSMWCRA